MYSLENSLIAVRDFAVIIMINNSKSTTPDKKIEIWLSPMIKILNQRKMKKQIRIQTVLSFSIRP